MNLWRCQEEVAQKGPGDNSLKQLVIFCLCPKSLEAAIFCKTFSRQILLLRDLGAAYHRHCCHHGLCTPCRILLQHGRLIIFFSCTYINEAHCTIHNPCDLINEKRKVSKLWNTSQIYKHYIPQQLQKMSFTSNCQLS